MTNQDSDINLLSGAFIESLYEDFQRDPQTVPDQWREYFTARDGNGRVAPPATDDEAEPAPPAETEYPDHAAAQGHAPQESSRVKPSAVLQDRVDQMVRAYRVRGHMLAQLDPLGLPRAPQPELEAAHYGLTDADLDRPVSSRTIAGPPPQSLRELLKRLRNTYCRSIGVQFMHIDDADARHWLQERMESTENHIALSGRQQLRILTSLTAAVAFEEFVQRKYVGAKTFSLEGSESLIPLLDLALERLGEHGTREVVVGMAHRGRLSVLANIGGKPLADIFREFEDADTQTSAGDVKYHLGYSSDWDTAAGEKIHLSFSFNPSHLEFINPVALGRMRAKQDRAQDDRRERGVVLLIHGDAAFAGEGIVQETLNLSELAGYTVGGSVHVIVNNQIGFTTPADEARSTEYPTAVAKMLQSPIFHVNGEDPEAVAQVVYLAIDFRMEFHRDVVINLYGYRRRGHNEIDEPSYTQPLMYKAIRERQSVREGYVEHLEQLGKVSRVQAEQIAESTHTHLTQELAVARTTPTVERNSAPAGIWDGYHGGPEDPEDEPATGVEATRLSALMQQLLVVPEGFTRHPRLERFVQSRKEMAEGQRPLDWSSAEALALATLATERYRIRLAGQDTARGTFSQRHAVLHDYETGEQYVPLQHVDAEQAPVEVINSPLSEAGVLGFEYGYSLDCPDGLVAWEAQYGDFWNAAQVIVDQLIVAAEKKWQRLSGVVLLLPHGFEGQGPEHSSARPERLLALSAEHNIQVAQPSTPAQYFHLLRRQMLRRWRKPLVVLTPKSLLRHPAVVSSLDDLADGAFQRVIPDTTCDPAAARRILLCSGKIYYDLDAARTERSRADIAIVRLEQYYPLPLEQLAAALAPYADETPVYWVQEEPMNMGAWYYLRTRLLERICKRFPFAGFYRPESASPGSGSIAAHKREQTQLIDEAFAIEE
jgi:2-oxoglutarate dehydrogenase E1 component